MCWGGSRDTSRVRWNVSYRTRIGYLKRTRSDEEITKRKSRLWLGVVARFRGEMCFFRISYGASSPHPRSSRRGVFLDVGPATTARGELLVLGLLVDLPRGRERGHAPQGAALSLSLSRHAAQSRLSFTFRGALRAATRLELAGGVHKIYELSRPLAETISCQTHPSLAGHDHQTNRVIIIFQGSH